MRGGGLRSCARLAEDLPIARPGLESFVQPVHAEELVGCVEVLVRRGEREEDRVESHVALEQLRDWHRAAHAHYERPHAVRRMQSRICRLQREVVYRDVRRT